MLNIITTQDIIDGVNYIDRYINPLPQCAFEDFNLTVPFLLPHEVQNLKGCLGVKIPDNTAIELVYKKYSDKVWDNDIGFLFYGRPLFIDGYQIQDYLWLKKLRCKIKCEELKCDHCMVIEKHYKTMVQERLKRALKKYERQRQ